VKVVREWLRVSGHVDQPQKVHPCRPVLGLECKRSEVSGRKFWGLFQQLCGDPDIFFKNAFVYNYCPLAFMTNTGKNITPDKLKVLFKLLQVVLESCIVMYTHNTFLNDISYYKQGLRS